MRIRWLVGIIIVMIVMVVSVPLAWLFPATIYVSLGLLRREAFFDGKPTSYWIRAFKQENFLGHPPPAGDIGKTLRDGGSAAVPVLCEIAEDPDDNLRSEALLGLSLIGPEAKAAAPVLAATIKKEKNSTRFLLASEAFAKVDAAAAAEALSAVLRDKEDGSRRAWALTSLLKIAPQGREALPALNEMLLDQDEDVRLRVQAIQVLWRLQEPAEPLVTALCDIVSADNCTVGVEALEVLGEMGPVAKPAVPALLKLLNRPTLAMAGRWWGPPNRVEIVRTLRKIGPEARAAVPALIASLKSGNSIIRIEVARALAGMGPSAKEALIARDAVSWTSITLLAARPPGNLAALPLVQIVRRTWIPREAQTFKAVREAIQKIDPDTASRASRR